ncbi:alpha-glucuronidase family glycosyl hydrolase [Olivibacter sitiensis]|uniref:alpha-glucuronidase family glycosyl hydrolase n=1 Tax=Olivibacter sitiensis TaxID=376470 RepID=UPI00047F220C|nr:alpha-glucuronidase family glycosyl hydrolase [Olivibacter sitiensis]
MHYTKYLLFLAFFLLVRVASAENGYELWMRYTKVSDEKLLTRYQELTSSIHIPGNSATLDVIRAELRLGIGKMLGKIPHFTTEATAGILIGQLSDIPSLYAGEHTSLEGITEDGYAIYTKEKQIVITAPTDAGLLYATFHLLRLIQTGQSLERLHLTSSPKVKLRLLNHWDNLNRTVERGYAGFSIWDWHTLPDYIDERYIDYARANASIGINGVVLTNVNASATALTPSYLQKVKALADVMRPYHIKVYLTARFSAPLEIGRLETADPLNKEVKRWWKEKTDEIYALIPDFGGFLVKANSEGQPGPQDYGRTHAEGANMLADVLAPHQGIVMWRAFVYSHEALEDRHKQAYNEFVPLDGKFRDNVLVQVKNGAIDFMPREPFHPLFGAMPQTPLMMEFQLTQEYLGQATHLVYLAPLFKECLNSDTYAQGEGSTVAKIVDGSLDKHRINGIAGVSNIGNDINWCGHPFAQANWYAFGRLCWDYDLNASEIAKEWLKMTFSNDSSFVEQVCQIMMGSREALVNYMNPIGLHHLMGTGHHYGPAPWVDDLPRADWNPTYYHKADTQGIGFDRTTSGSNALSQYHPEVRRKWEDLSLCEDEYLLWFHHLPWDDQLKDGHSIWEKLCESYYSGMQSVKTMQEVWDRQQNKIDDQRFKQVQMLLAIQYKEAKWWRDACLLYFQTFSGQEILPKHEKVAHTLEYYRSLHFPYAPGHW